MCHPSLATVALTGSRFTLLPCSVTIAAGGVLPNIHSVLLPSSKKGKAKGGSVSQEF
jgi:C-terminus of histone H2A